jgi:hypothetical protein
MVQVVSGNWGAKEQSSLAFSAACNAVVQC